MVPHRDGRLNYHTGERIRIKVGTYPRMPEYVDPLEGAGAILGVLSAFGGFWMIGQLVPGRAFWEYPLLGWAFAYLLAVVATLCGIHDLSFILALTGALAVVAVIWRRPRFRRHSLAPYLAAIPLLALSLVNVPIFWDSYAHWLPNSAYLYRLDHFVREPLGEFYSLHPTYPSALPLIIYISSGVAGFLTELAGNVSNVVMFLLAMGCIWQLLRDCWPLQSQATANPRSLHAVIAALAFCIAVPANPAIEIQFYWSAMADPALAVLVLVMIVECCRLMASERQDSVRASVLLLFALGGLSSGLKPNAWLIAVVLGVTAGLVGVIHRVPARRWLLPALAIVGGTMFGTASWELYLQQHLTIPDQFVVRPLADWSYRLAPDVLLAMLGVLRTNTLYSIVVLVSMGAGVGR